LETRTCKICSITKDSSEFYAGQGNTCKDCTKQKTRAWRKANPVRYRATRQSWEKDNVDLAVKRKRARIKRRYKLPYEKFLEMLKAQDYRCAICGVALHDLYLAEVPSEETTKPVVDHDHRDGHVRGLLCSSCNVGLGLFEDKKKFLRAAINYLKRDQATGA
jgi:hypothetical protein